MTGFRLSIGGVQQETGIIPDLTAMGKIIGGGLPVGAIGGKVEIMDYFALLARSIKLALKWKPAGNGSRHCFPENAPK